MTADQFPDAANPAKAQRIIENIRVRFARGQEALQAERNNPEMTTRRFAEERNVPVQQIRRDKQFAQVFSERELEKACRLRQLDGMPLWRSACKADPLRRGNRTHLVSVRTTRGVVVGLAEV